MKNLQGAGSCQKWFCLTFLFSKQVDLNKLLPKEKNKKPPNLCTLKLIVLKKKIIKNLINRHWPSPMGFLSRHRNCQRNWIVSNGNTSEKRKGKKKNEMKKAKCLRVLEAFRQFDFVIIFEEVQMRNFQVQFLFWWASLDRGRGLPRGSFSF